MKKINLLFLMAILLLGLAACSSDRNTSDKISVVTSLYPQYDVVRALAKEYVELEYVLQPGVSAHSYEPTARTIISILEADVFIYASDELERWVHDFLDTYDTGDLVVINLSQHVTLLDIDDYHNDYDADHDDHDNHDEDHDEHDDHNHGSVDPHFWNDPHNMIKVVSVIEAALQPFVGADTRDAIAANAQAYIDRLNAFDAELIEVVNHSNNPTMMHGGHNSMGYLVHRYGIHYVNPYEGFSSDSTPTPSGIQAMIETMTHENINHLFSEKLLSQAVANTIQEETGAEILYVYAGANLSKDEFDQGLTLLEMFEHNLEMFKIGFGYDESTTN